MNEDTLAIFMIFGVLPAMVFGFVLLNKRMRMASAGEAWNWPWLRGHGGLAQRPGPDGRTVIELEKLRLADRDKARALFERLSIEKLGVLRDSIQMGYKQEDLVQLDARLERIIGSEQLQRLLGESLPSGSSAAALSSGAAPLAAEDLLPGPGLSSAATRSGSSQP